MSDEPLHPIIKEFADGLFNALKHGDSEHQAWLREAIEAYLEQKPVPAPRGQAMSEALAKIAEEQDDVIKRLLFAYRNAMTCLHKDFGDTPQAARDRAGQSYLVRAAEALRQRYGELIGTKR